MKRLVQAAFVVLLLAAVAPFTSARELSMDDRVQAQRIIDDDYRAHQIGAATPAMLPRAAQEKKALTYLRQTVALEKYWHTQVTPEALERELARITRGTRDPERLSRLFTALGHDPVLLRECLARPLLVERLTRGFFAYDAEIHAESRRLAESLRQQVVRLGVKKLETNPGYSEFSLVAVDELGRAPAGLHRSGDTIAVTSDELGRWRAALPTEAGYAGPVREERDAFTIDTIVEEAAHSVRVARLTVPKKRWSRWWDEVSPGLDATPVVAGITADAATVVTPISIEPTKAGAASHGDGPPCAADDTWDPSWANVADVRYAHSAVWTGTEMIVWGGWAAASGFVIPVGESYDPLTDTWAPVSSVGAPEPRARHLAAWTGTEMLVWGGQNDGTGGRYDPAVDSWAPLSTVGAPPAMGTPRYQGVWAGDEMIVLHGGLEFGHRYDPDADTWTPISMTGAPLSRRGYSILWTGDEIVVWGGDATDTGGRYDPVLDAWTSTSGVGAPQGRDNHSAIWTGDEMIIWGGLSGAKLDTGGRYDPTLDTWMTTSTVGAPSARSSHASVWAGETMIVWGGGEDNVVGGRYDPATDSWTAISAAGAPQPSTSGSGTTVWTGDLMIVWGGGITSDPGPVNTGGRYDPQSDTWTYPAGAAPTQRRNPIALWTGNQMLLVGGTSYAFPEITGDRYDPLTDHWAGIADLGLPLPSTGTAGVWTGTHMIVWGGDDSLGGRYDPLSDSWEPISLVDAPSGRTGHTAVWSGSEMIVWGSDDSHTTGGRYDPATDAWTETSIIGAPAARSGHTAVWTGSEMLIWGEPGNSVWRYAPATDTWVSSTPPGGPSARSGHRGLWTGTEMIVWGGKCCTSPPPFFNCCSNGGRYDPVTDGWAPVSTSGDPVSGEGHSAVWTGTEMIVWGGTLGINQWSGSGGRYDPVTNSWTSTGVGAGRPWSRGGHSAVWTGSEMIVWGGLGVVFGTHSDPLNNGGIYALGHSVDNDADGLSECDGDCNDADAGAFAVPGEITDLTFGSNKTSLSWNSGAPSSGPGTVHDVLSGDLAGLVGIAPTSCVNTVSAATVEATVVPAQGSGFWYLVRGRNTCGVGSYGQSSDSEERVSTTCP